MSIQAFVAVSFLALAALSLALGVILVARWGIAVVQAGGLTPVLRRRFALAVKPFAASASFANLALLGVLFVEAAISPAPPVRPTAVTFVYPDGNEHSLGQSEASECVTRAAQFARAHHLFESSWSYRCEPITAATQ
jgi:hypothetical protein